jgi:signal transduction histidine kinase
MSSTLPRRTLALAFIAAAYGIGWGAVLLTGALSGSDSFLLTSVAYTLASLLAGAAILAIARLHGEDERRAWRLIGLGTLSWATADVIYAWYELSSTQLPYPGPSDLFYLAAYPLWIGGVLAFPYARGSRFSHWRLLLDGLAGTAALALLMWHLYLKDVVVVDGATWLERLVNPAYPMGDLILLSGLVILSVRRSPHRLHRPLILLALGVVCNAAADIVYWMTYDSYQIGSWLDGFWVLGYGLFTVAALTTTSPVTLREVPDRRVSLRNLVVPYSLVLTLMTLTGYQVVTGSGDSDYKVLLIGAGLVSLIVIARQSIALREFGEAVERERRDLVSSISHELRTPLTAMSGFSELLAEEWDSFPDPERHELLISVAGQTQYLARIVTDLIEVSRDNLAQTRLSLGRHSAATLIDEARTFANLTTATFATDLNDDMEVVADRNRVIQILVNLMTNAVRYGHGRVVVVARSSQQGTRIEVHDDGPGVPVKYRELIWERFERGAHRFDAVTPGSGLGLSIVKGLVDAHGGSVGYEHSDRLGGACLWFTLPTIAWNPEPMARLARTA